MLFECLTSFCQRQGRFKGDNTAHSTSRRGYPVNQCWSYWDFFLVTQAIYNPIIYPVVPTVLSGVGRVNTDPTHHTINDDTRFGVVLSEPLKAAKYRRVVTQDHGALLTFGFF